MPRARRWPLQLFRIATLVVPPAAAWDVAFSAPHPSRLTVAVTYLLGPLWLLMAGALLARSVDALLRRRRGGRGGELSLLDQIDVLTASGSSTIWLASGAIAASVWVGWASLSVVGLMGLCFAQLVVLWTLLVAGGDDPFRVASVSRRFVPASVVEGDPVVEEVRFSDVRIPTGFRLFAGGRIGPRWPMTRYAIEEDASGGEILLESDVGPAVRGDHRAEPLELWLQDVFGLCRSVRLSAGHEAAISVLPRLRPVDGTHELLGRGGHDLDPRPVTRLPTEGSFRLREYQPGEDARRIHWVRSLAARQVVVRLPDELPPERPSVRLVLDTLLVPAGHDGGHPQTPGALTCAAHEELLDALVRVWLGVGRALVESGARVTLVTASRQGIVRRRLTAEALSTALRLGAEVRWQDALSVADLLSDEPSIVVSYRLQPDPGTEKAAESAVRWINVPVSVWARFDEPLQQPSLALLPHPMGSPENRWSHRRRERMRLLRARRDRGLLLDACAPTRDRHEHRGTFVARPVNPSRILVEAL
jgi:uncharacterized protein (DUF58 family)